MKTRFFQLLASTAVVAVAFVQSASANDCPDGQVTLKYFRPEVTRVVTPAPQASDNTTPIALTAPQHNANPSPLVPQAPKVVEVACVNANTELEVDVNFAQEEVGSVIMHYGKFEMELPVTEWSKKRIRFMTPDIGVLASLNVSVHIYRPDGYLVRQFDAVLVRQASIREVVRTIDSLPLPTVASSQATAPVIQQ